MFDYRDNYYWNDFRCDILNNDFKNMDDVIFFFTKNFPRVARQISIKNSFMKKVAFGEPKEVSKTDMKETFIFSFEVLRKDGSISNIDVKCDLFALLEKCKIQPLKRITYDPLCLDNSEFNFYIPPLCILNDKPTEISYEKYKLVLDTLKETYFTGYKKYLNDELEKENYDKIFHLWISRLRSKVKYPHLKSKCVFVMTSKEGYGKGTLMEFLSEYIFGEYCCKDIATMNALTQRFNSFSSFKLYINIDEAPHQTGEYHMDWDKMKKFITDKNHLVEFKNKEPISIKNYTEIDIYTNNVMCVRITDDDTRYCVMELYEEKRDWNKIREILHNKDNAMNFIHYLINDDDDKYVKFYARPEIPLTHIKERVQDFCRDSVLSFKKEIINGNYVINEKVFLEPFTHNKKVIFFAIPCKTFKLFYDEWCENNNEKPKKVKEIKQSLNQYRKGSLMYYYLDE